MYMTWSTNTTASSVDVQRYWNYSGNPVTTALTTTAVQVLTAVTQPRAISFSVTATEGVLIKIWVNADPLTDDPILTSFAGHNVFDMAISGAVHMATATGTASIVIDTATLTTAS